MEGIQRGTTSLTVPFRFVDANGIPKTGLVFSTTGLACVYLRELDNAPTTVTLQTMTLGTWATGGFIEQSAGSMPGSYSLGVPNAAISASDASKWVEIYFVGTNVYSPPLRIDLVAYNTQDAVRLGLTALPNANAEAAGGLYTRGSGAGQINQPGNGLIDINAKQWLGGVIPAVSVTGVPLVDIKYLLGTAFTEGAVGRLVAGIKQFFNVASPTSTMNEVTLVDTTTTLSNAPSDSSGVTTLLSRIGAALTISGGAVDANIIKTLGTTLAAVAGYVGLDWSHINAPTTAVDFTGTTIKNVDNAIANVTTVATTTNLTNAPTAGDFTAAMKTSLNAATPAVTVSDKTGFSLSAAEHTAISGTDVPAGLMAQGYTSTRAGYLDALNGIVSAVQSGLATLASQVTINSNVLGIPAAVWAYATRTLTSASGPTVQQIVDGVWDEPNASHVATGSTGLNLSNAGDAVSPATIAAAVWNYTLSTPTKAGDMLLALYRRMLDAGAIVFQNPVDATQTKVRVQAGATYYASEGRQLPFTAPAGVDLTDASVEYFATVNGNEELPINGTVVDSNHYYFELPLDASDNPLTNQFTEGPFVVIITLANNHTLWGAWGDQIVKRIRH